MKAHDTNENPASSEAVNHALVEAHKQASAEVSSDIQMASHQGHETDCCGDVTEASDSASVSTVEAQKGEALRQHGFVMHDNSRNGSKGPLRDKDVCSSVISPLLSRSEKLCVRHQRMADEGATARLQKSIDTLSLAEQTAVNTVWSLFSSSSHSQRALILRGILTMCCFSQLSLLSSELAMAIRIDPFTLFPREVSLRVLGYLDAISLGRAAQVSRLWRTLADNDLLWRNMCEQHIERKCEKCGWGLPLLTERRRLKGTDSLNQSEPTGVARDDEYREAANASGNGTLRRTVTAAANAAAIERRSRQTPHTPSPDTSHVTSPAAGPASKRQKIAADGEGGACLEQKPAVRGKHKTRPWKAVYCERLVIERNWRRGRHSVRILQGHTDGIMSLSFRETVSGLPYPVLITGSYDRTIRVWNMRTGQMLRSLTGHARGVRCLQFDDVKLITGSMDRTLKIWNWRTGELLRTLEGHTEGIVSLNFNESVLASGSADSNIRVWNFHTGECFSLRGHRDWVNAVQLWSPAANRKEDGSGLPMFLFSASDDGTIRLWDLQTRESLMVYRGHVGQVQSLKLVMMDHASVQKLSSCTTTLPSHVTDADGNDAAPAPSSGSEKLSGNGYLRPAASCSYTPSPAQVDAVSSGPVSGPGHYRFSHVPTASGPPTTSDDTMARARAVPPAIALVQQRLGAAGLVPPLPPSVSLEEIEDGIFAHDPLQNGDHAPSPKGPCKSKRPVLVSGSLDNTLKLWDVRTGQCFRTLFGHVEGVWGVDVDTLRIVSASHDRTVKVWDRDTAQCQNTLVGHRAAVTCIGLGDDKIVSGGDDGDVRVWSFAPEPALEAPEGAAT